MDNLNQTIETLRTQFGLLETKDTRTNKTAVRKTLQDLKNKCHALRKEILGKTKAVVIPIAPPSTPEPEPVEEIMPEAVPESQPEPVFEEVKPEKKLNKRKKTKKSV